MLLISQSARVLANHRKPNLSVEPCAGRGKRLTNLWGEPSLLVQYLPSPTDLVRVKNTLALIPFVRFCDRFLRRVGALARRNPMHRGEQFHTIGCFKSVNQPCYPLKASL